MCSNFLLYGIRLHILCEQFFCVSVSFSRQFFIALPPSDSDWIESCGVMGFMHMLTDTKHSGTEATGMIPRPRGHTKEKCATSQS